MKKALLYSALLGSVVASGSATAVDFDGFLTAGFAVHDQEQTDGSKVTYLDEVTDNVTFLQDSKFGLQMTADVAEDMQVVAQILASAEDSNYAMDIEWAYLDYTLSDSSKLRMGRIKQLVFLISDYLEVGYAYPWIRPPAEAYSNMPVDSLIGVELLYQTNLGGMNLAVQPYFGSNTEGVPGFSTANFFADNYIGMAVRLESSVFTFQVSTFHTDVSTVDSGATGLNSEGEATLSVVSMSWDVANFIGYTEFTTRDIEPDKVTDPVRFDSLFSDQDAYYVTLGYRIGKFLPHITFATVDSDPINLTPACSDTSNPLTCGPSQGARQDSITLGMRYEINDSTALKVEYQTIEIEDNAANFGLFQPVAVGAGGAGAAGQGVYEDEKTSMFSVAVDVIF